MGINIDIVGRSIAAITASALHGRLSTCFWNMAVGIYAHSATRILARLGINVRGEGLVCSVGVAVRALQISQVLPNQTWQTMP